MMSTMKPISRTVVVPSRRQFLHSVSMVTLSARCPFHKFAASHAGERL